MNIINNIRNEISRYTPLDLLVMTGVSLFLFIFFMQAMAGMLLFLSQHIDLTKYVIPTNAEFYLSIFRFGEDFKIYPVILAGIAFMILFIKKNHRRD